MSTGRSILAIGAGIVVLVVGSFALVALADRGRAAFPAGSVEATLRDYLAAWDSEDYEGCYASFSSDVRNDAALADYRRLAEEMRPGLPESSQRTLYFKSANFDGSRAVAHLIVEERYDSGFSISTYSRELSIRMAVEGGRWLIDEPMLGLESWPGFGQPY